MNIVYNKTNIVRGNDQKIDFENIVKTLLLKMPITKFYGNM